jgi:hypothetical protein
MVDALGRARKFVRTCTYRLVMGSALWVLGFGIGIAFSVACVYVLFTMLRGMRGAFEAVLASSRAGEGPWRSEAQPQPRRRERARDRRRQPSPRRRLAA